MHTLLTIPFSPYNEKARWALDRFAVPYREKRWVPPLHIPAVAWATRFGRDGVRDRVSSRFSTPVLVTADGLRLCDSHDIVQWVDRHFATPQTSLLFDERAAVLERELGEGLGPHARRVAYGFGLADPRAYTNLARLSVGPVQAGVARAFSPLLIGTIVRALRVRPDRVQRSLAFVHECFVDIGRRLEGRPYLLGDRLSAADLAFACMASPVLVPSHAEGFGAELPALAELTPEAARLANELRDTPAGRYAMRLFREDRRQVVRQVAAKRGA